MPAGVVEAANLPVLAAHANNRLAHELERVVVTRVRDIAGMANDLPRLPKDHLLFQLKKLLVVVDPGGEREGIFVLDGGGCGHRTACRYRVTLLNDRSIALSSPSAAEAKD